MEHAREHAAIGSAKEEARLIQSTLQDSGYGGLIGDFAIERLKAFIPEDESPGIVMTSIPHDPNYIFSDDKTALDVDEIDPLPPYSQEAVFHDTASQTSTTTHDTAHEPRAREEVIAASFPYEDENMDESLLDAPAPPYSIGDILEVN